MKIFAKISIFLWAGIMLLGAIPHFTSPEFYDPFIPGWFPTALANYGAGVAEFVLAVGMLIPAYRKYAIWGIFGLMVLFLPIHIWDLFRENPAIGSQTAAIIRVPIQLLLIGWSYWLAKRLNQTA